MCEFCPVVGRCSICDSVVSVDYRTTRSAPPSTPTLSTSSDEGFPVTYRGVTVRFERHSDAMACLQAIPQARVI
jgi:hypothetical protein